MRRFRRRKNDPQNDDIIEGIIEDIEAEEASETEAEDVELPPALERFEREQKRRDRKRERPSSEVRSTPPLERVAPDVPTPLEHESASALTPYSPSADAPPREQTQPKTAAPRRRLKLPRLLAWEAINTPLLFGALGLVGGGLLWTLHNIGQTSSQVEAWWPAIPLAFGIVWGFVALMLRRALSFLAAAAFIGLSFSLLLDTQDLLAWQETLAGSVLIALGLGIITRGLVLRQGVSA